ncbi:facilitated trehalose transporter Tret1-like [Lycorma delicatula]|uniref:facilitated trehalose transporter Tret1-like n=1 Tax=Lycorma delicatula TaxID=130591 RepID=UPI003F515D1E
MLEKTIPITLPVKGKNPGLVNLYFAAFTVTLPFFVVGSCLSWTSPTLPALESGKDWITVNEEQGSWIGSLLMLGATFGACLSGRLLDRIGRKKTIVIDIILLLVSWGCLASAKPINSLWVIYLGRFVSGIATGLAFAAIPLYVSEIAELSVRSALASLSEVFLAGGYLVEYCLGPLLSYSGLIVASSLMLIVSLVLFTRTPESPHYLILRGHRQEAVNELCWLRGNVPPSAVEEEISSIEMSMLVRKENKHGSFKDLVTDRANVRALLVCCGLSFFQQFSGINVMLAYAEPIFMKTSSHLSASGSAIVVGLVQFLTACCTPFVVNQFGFKRLLLCSAAIMSIAQGALGMYFFMDDNNIDVSLLSWLPVSSAMLYIVSYCLGFGPLVWAIMGEMYSPSIKEIGTSSSTCFNWFLAFIITKLFTNITQILGPYAAFWLFSCCCIFAFLFTLFVLPDTKGLSLQEIQDLLNGKKPNNNANPS